MEALTHEIGALCTSKTVIMTFTLILVLHDYKRFQIHFTAYRVCKIARRMCRHRCLPDTSLVKCS